MISFVWTYLPLPGLPRHTHTNTPTHTYLHTHLHTHTHPPTYTYTHLHTPTHTLTHLHTTPCRASTSPWRDLSSSPEGVPWPGVVDSITAGAAKVVHEAGGYALLADEPAVQYLAGRDCRLHQLATARDMRGYGIVLPKGGGGRGGEDVICLIYVDFPYNL